MRQLNKVNGWHIFLIALLLLLAACGGGADEAAEDTSETDSTGSTEEESLDEESMAAEEPVEDAPSADLEPIDEGLSATGSEEDSGEIPPTPDTGSKTDTERITPATVAETDTAVTTLTPPSNRADTDQTVSGQIDIVFVLDTTGSMVNELDTLKAGLNEISAQLSSLPNTVTFHYGLVLYGDDSRSDSIQWFDLTDSWDSFAQNITAVTPIGGGDYPENLVGGYYQAVSGMAWRPEATKLLILLGDAPPHQDDSNITLLNEALRLAAEQNITTFTIGSDGLNAPGVALYQEIAQNRNGRFLFVSESPDSSTLASNSVHPLANLPALLTGIILEVLDEEIP